MPSFHWPWALLLLLALPMPVYMMLRRPRQATVRFASLVDMRHCGVSWRSRLRVLLVAGRVLCPIQTNNQIVATRVRTAI